MATSEEEYQRRRRQTANARARQGLSPLPPPPTQYGPVEETQAPWSGPQPGVKETPAPWGQQQGGGDLAAKVEKLTQDVAEILTIVRSIQGNPPYAMLG